MNKRVVSENMPIPAQPDFARGQREEPVNPDHPDFARGQRTFEQYEQDFIAHYQALTGTGGRPFDYYKPGYQFGFDLAHDEGFAHNDWSTAEADARLLWDQKARYSWDEFSPMIRYGWEKAHARDEVE